MTSRARLPMTSIWVIFPFAIVNRTTLNNRPRGAITMPTAPLTSARRASRASCPKAIACFAQTAAPRISAGAPDGAGARLREPRDPDRGRREGLRSRRRATPQERHRRPRAAERERGRAPPRHRARDGGRGWQAAWSPLRNGRRSARSPRTARRTCRAARRPGARGIGAAQSQPRLLNGVVHFAQRAEHPVRHGAQVGSVFFESLGQIVALVHRSHFLVAFRHGTDAAASANVTRGGNQ